MPLTSEQKAQVRQMLQDLSLAVVILIATATARNILPPGVLRTVIGDGGIAATVLALMWALRRNRRVILSGITPDQGGSHEPPWDR